MHDNRICSCGYLSKSAPILIEKIRIDMFWVCVYDFPITKYNDEVDNEDICTTLNLFSLFFVK
jgi:hypothetical protein